MSTNLHASDVFPDFALLSTARSRAVSVGSPSQDHGREAQIHGWLPGIPDLWPRLTRVCIQPAECGFKPFVRGW